MKLNWNHSLSLSVAEHINVLLSSESFSCRENVSIARLTNALPVYSDLSGTLCINLDGTILHYDAELSDVKPIAEEGFVILAAVSAAIKYPDLQEMLPHRPPTAKPCPSCSGTGKQIQGKVFCGKCFGLGWELE